MKISFAVTVHNEGVYISKLIDILLEYIYNNNTPDEIIILDDNSTDYKTVSILNEYKTNSKIKIIQKSFKKDFSEHKNYLNSLCTGDYIFQIDADEYPAPVLLQDLVSILQSNPTIELFYIPRVNIVNGLTQHHIIKWGWKVDSRGYVMWPDYQGRLYKNLSSIKWINTVHERISGATEMTLFPPEEKYALIHIKDINRQELQNNLYESL